MSAPDLTKAEQENVRRALRFLRARADGWEPVAAALRFRTQHLAKVAKGLTVSPTVAIRVARLAKVGVDALLGGEYPPEGTCPHCGHCPMKTTH